MEILVIIFSVFSFFAKTINFGLIVDDVQWRKQIKAGLHRKKSYLKRIRYLLYGGGTLGQNIKIDHIFQTALHALVCVLIYLAFGKNNISFWAAILYAFHPINNQTAIWLNGRRYVVNIILVLMMLIIGWPYALLLYPVTGLFQISAIAAPVLFGWQGLLITCFGIPILFYRFWCVTFQIRYSKVPAGARKDYRFRRIIPIIKSYGYYFFSMLVPRQRLFYSQFLDSWGITKEGNEHAYKLNNHFYEGIIALSVTALMAIQFNPFFVLFMFLSIFQWCNLITATMTVADRYASLPNIFMMYFVSTLIHQVAGDFTIPILVGLSVYYLRNLYATMKMYEDLDAFYRYHIYFDPAGVSARSFAISELINQGDNIRALNHVQEGLAYRPKDFKFLYYAALCMFTFKEYNSASKYLDQAEQNYYLGQEDRLQSLINKLRNGITDRLNPVSQKKQMAEDREEAFV